MASRKVEADVVVKVSGTEEIEEAVDLVKELSDTTSTVEVEVEGEENVAKLREAFKDLDNVTVTAAAKVENQANVDDFIKSVRAFDGDVATAILAVRAGQARDELKEIVTIIGDIESTPAEVAVATGRLPQAKADLEALNAEILRVDSTASAASGGLSRMSAAGAGVGSTVSSAVGNATQDMLGFAGVTGTTGQAVSQLAEDFLSAASGAGGMGEALATVGKAAAPIAAIVATMSALGSIFDAAAARAERLAEATELVGDAAETSSTAVADMLREQSGAMREFDADARTAWGGFIEGATGAANAIPLIGSLIPDDAFQNISDAAAAFDAAGFSAYELGKAMRGGREDIGAYMTSLEIAAEQGRITADQLSVGKQQLEVWAEGADQAEQSTGFFATTMEEFNDLMDQAGDPLKQNSELWKVLMDDMRDGEVTTQAAMDAQAALGKELGKTPEQIRAIAQAGLDDEMKAAADAADAERKAIEEANKALAEHVIAVAKAQGAVDELASAFSLMSINGDALQSVFDLGNAPIDLLGEVLDVEQGIRDFAEFVKSDLGGKIPNIFNPDDVNADDFIAKIQSLRDPIQQQIKAAFAAGGPTAAQEVADNYVDEIVKQLGGKLTAEQVRSLLNLENLQATIDIAVNQSKIEQARRALQILVGLGGETPWTASIELALAAGTISPETAQILINEKLGGLGVEVPTTLGVPDAGPATVAAAIWARDHPLEFTTTANSAGAEEDLAWLTNNPWATEVTIDGDKKPADSKIEEVDQKAKSTKPEVAIGASIKEAITTMLIINAIAKAMAPVVSVGANTFPAIGAVAAAVSIMNSMHVRVPVDAYIRNIPSASDIAARIGTVRVPIDAYVRTMPRINGTP